MASPLCIHLGRARPERQPPTGRPTTSSWERCRAAARPDLIHDMPPAPVGVDGHKGEVDQRGGVGPRLALPGHQDRDLRLVRSPADGDRPRTCSPAPSSCSVGEFHTTSNDGDPACRTRTTDGNPRAERPPPRRRPDSVTSLSVTSYPSSSGAKLGGAGCGSFRSSGEMVHGRAIQTVAATSAAAQSNTARRRPDRRRSSRRRDVKASAVSTWTESRRTRAACSPSRSTFTASLLVHSQTGRETPLARARCDLTDPSLMSRVRAISSPLISYR